MEYCIIENAYKDLKRAYEKIAENQIIESPTELAYSVKLFKLCKKISKEFGYE
jgi:hypothetical protein